jgi:hydroxymethylglutaryl-CoA lyase
VIRMFEVGPRDGLQNEKKLLTLDQKLNLIEGLLKTGLDNIEVGAFVRQNRIPQMAGTEEIYRSERLQQWKKEFPSAKFWSLVPNEKGLDRAIDCGAGHIAVFGGATETFVRKNIGMTIQESLDAFASVVKRGLQEGMEVRGYISVCWVCPYEGEVSPEAVLRVVLPMLQMGVQEISLGDTIGRAHPLAVDKLLSLVLQHAPAERYAVHFHDTYGMALANIDRSIQLGITVVDSSIGGLGGCPYAPGAAGNVATEDVYTLLEGYTQRGTPAQTLDLPELMITASLAQDLVGRTLPSKRLTAYFARAE